MQLSATTRVICRSAIRSADCLRWIIVCRFETTSTKGTCDTWCASYACRKKTGIPRQLANWGYSINASIMPSGLSSTTCWIYPGPQRSFTCLSVTSTKRLQNRRVADCSLSADLLDKNTQNFFSFSLTPSKSNIITRGETVCTAKSQALLFTTSYYLNAVRGCADIQNLIHE